MRAVIEGRRSRTLAQDVQLARAERNRCCRDPVEHTPLGTYVLLTCAADAGSTVEGDESNNCKASLGSVRVQ